MTCVSAVVEGFLVDWCCFIERFFVIRNLRQTSINKLWDVLDNAWQVIRFFVDIEQDVINNGNRTEWSPIQSVIIRVINKIGRP